MYSQVKVANELVVGFDLLDFDLIKPHEFVVEERFNSLVSYLESLKPYIIIPSILVCSKTNVLIDGHHRYYALQKFGVKKIPVTFIVYESDRIVTDLVDERVTKEAILQSGSSGILMPPKTSFHHIIDEDNNLYPLILLSCLYSVPKD